MGEKKKKMGIIDKNKKSKIKYQKLKKIYILHGWSYTTEKWEPFLELLKKSGVEGVLLKIPGLTAPLEKPWTLDDYVSWLFEIIKNESQVTILGHSNGGRIALAFALQHPEKVKQLFLIDTAGIYHKELFIRFKRKVFRNVANIGKKIAPKNFRSVLYKIAREHDYEQANPVLQETMRNIITVDLLPKLSSITVKTIIIWGRKDKTTPFKDAVSMHKLIKNSQLFSIAEARHSPQFTHASKVMKIVIENFNA